MPTSFEQAEESVHEMAQRVMRQHHAGTAGTPGLKFLDASAPEGFSFVRLCILMAFSDEENEPALKCDGFPVQAIVSVIPLKQRVDKRADAEIVIDKAKWEEFDEPKRLALLDHCIEHIEIHTDENGIVKTDDIGRPKLRLKTCDFRLQGFRSIARRHGENAPEVIAARQFEHDFGDDVLRAAGLFSTR